MLLVLVEVQSLLDFSKGALTVGRLAMAVTAMLLLVDVPCAAALNNR